MESTRKETGIAQARLGLWDVTSIVVGVIIGVGIFETPRYVFANAPGSWEALGVWALGGVLAFVGALCFAELASTYPQSGGEYVYLTRAFGSVVGFLFAWAQLAVIRPAGIAVFAYIFAKHAYVFLPLPPLAMALAAVAGLSVINILGVTLGTTTQNVLTLAKVAGLSAIVVVGLLFSHDPVEVLAAPSVSAGWFAAAMIAVLWTYSGWHEAAYVAAETKDQRRNLPLSLMLGTLTVTIIYLLVNGALLVALGLEGARSRSPVDIFRGWMGRSIHVLIMVSALGALNGMIFTTARIYSAFGADHRLFRPLSHWSGRLGTPVRALTTQCVLGLVYLLLGTASVIFTEVVTEGRSLAEIGELLAAEQSLANLNYWINLTQAVFWSFFLLTGIALFVLRVRDPDADRPFRVPLYPFLPLVFCAWCGYMVYGAIASSPKHALFGLLVLLAGLPLYCLPQKRRQVRTGDAAKPRVVAERTYNV